MTGFQKTIRGFAIVLAVFLTVSIIGGIISIIGFFGDFTDDSTVPDEAMKTYPIASEIRSLYVDINAADITVKQGKTFSVESNLKHLNVSDKNGLLTIRETGVHFKTRNPSALIITIPDETEFDSAELKTGAGRLVVDTLSAKGLDCDFGAGEIKIDRLLVTSNASIDGGTGKITISGGKIQNLDFDMGVGQLNFTSQLTGQCDFDLGIGETNITLLGTKDDYVLDVEKGIGNITVDGVGIENMNGFGSGQNKIEINGGIGAVHVTYKATEGI